MAIFVPIPATVDLGWWSHRRLLKRAYGTPIRMQQFDYFSFEGDNAVLHVSHFGLVKFLQARQARRASTLALKLLQGHTSTVSAGNLLALSLNAPGSITLRYPSSTNGTTNTWRRRTLLLRFRHCVNAFQIQLFAVDESMLRFAAILNFVWKPQPFRLIHNPPTQVVGIALYRYILCLLAANLRVQRNQFLIMVAASNIYIFSGECCLSGQHTAGADGRAMTASCEKQAAV